MPMATTFVMRAATHKVKRPFDHVILKGQVTNQERISTTTVHMATKLCEMVTYLDGLLPIKLHDPLITWLCEILGKAKTIISPLTLDHHQQWQGNGLRWRASIYKITQPLKHRFMWDYATNYKHGISTITMSVVTKLVRLMTYTKELSAINQHGP